VRLILASSSPRRHALLGLLGLPFEVARPDVDEEAVWARWWRGPGSGRRAARRLAMAKARAVEASLQAPALVLAADTVVLLGGNVLNKPSNAEHARQMLRSLSGLTHEVVTGVALIGEGISSSASACTRVRFGRLRDAEIESYIQSGEPFDKAGGYGIQGLGGLLVERIDGPYDNVVGLPMRLVYRLLRRHGVTIW
jgi:septum formation protein